MSKAVGTIPLLRFVRPNGERLQESITVSVPTLQKWVQLQYHYTQKLRLTIEDLNNGTTSLCIENTDKGDLEIRVVHNKDVHRSVSIFGKMIDSLFNAVAAKLLKEKT